MRGFVPRLLVLSCSLLLALPPGWCCIFAFSTTRNENAKTAPCCRSCCHQANPTTPTPKPVPPKPTRCPCDDRQTTAPESAKTIHGDLFALAVLPVLDLAPTALTVAVPLVASFFVSSSPQLLHCIWLC